PFPAASFPSPPPAGRTPGRPEAAEGRRALPVPPADAAVRALGPEQRRRIRPVETVVGVPQADARGRPTAPLRRGESEAVRGCDNDEEERDRGRRTIPTVRRQQTAAAHCLGWF
ncbi:hypothetical protein THAOC_15815, partial [Thalassiosira oceanica]